MQLNKPYLLFLGASQSMTDCKTAAGLRDWCRDDVMGQMGLPGCAVDLRLPWYRPAEAVAAGGPPSGIRVGPRGGGTPRGGRPRPAQTGGAAARPLAGRANTSLACAGRVA